MTREEFKQALVLEVIKSDFPHPVYILEEYEEYVYGKKAKKKKAKCKTSPSAFSFAVNGDFPLTMSNNSEQLPK